MSGSALVSCLMVSKPRPDRLSFTKASIAAYTRQTYKPTELVVVLDDGDDDTAEAVRTHIEGLGRFDIRLVDRGPLPASLGALRNRSVEHARGAIVCQWDDDDLSHPDRIRRQTETMAASGKPSCFLQEVLHYVAPSRTLHWTNWSMAPVRAHPGTLTCERHAMPSYPSEGPQARLEEDRAVLTQLESADAVAVLGAEPHLFIYVTHGQNTWSAHHHQMLLDRLSVSVGILRRREAQIRTALGAFDLGPGDVTIMGSNGPAFTWTAAHRLPD